MTSAPRELTGQRFGRLSVRGTLPHAHGTNPLWDCRCDCGGRTAAQGPHLVSGHTTSCGCRSREVAQQCRPWRRRRLKGHQIGDLLVLGTVPNVPSRLPNGATAWLCRCLRCSREIVVKTCDLTRPRHPTTHCGCRHLRPAVKAIPIPATPARPIVTTRPAPLEDTVPTSGQQALNNLFEERHGRPVPIRREPDDDTGRVLFDRDPFADFN